MKNLLLIILLTTLSAQVQYEVRWETMSLFEAEENIAFGKIASWVSAVDYRKYKIIEEQQSHKFSNIELAKAFIEGMTTDKRRIFEKGKYHKNIELYKIERIE